MGGREEAAIVDTLWHRLLPPRADRLLKRSRRPLRLELLEERTLLTLAPADGASEPAPDALVHGLLVSCPVYPGQDLPRLPTAESVPLAAPVEAGALLSVPQLHSDPSARAKLFLDFDGHFEARWGDKKNVSTPAFDQDGDPASFSTAELAAIDEIWARVAEDFAPFNLDVTTFDPGSYKHGIVAVIAIGGDYSDWYGESAGGVAFVAGFTDSELPNVGYVFSNTLHSVPNAVADAASHEAGHLFGLNHQSVWSGGKLVDEYNPGNGGWAPLMGTSYNAARSTWYNGTPDTSSKVKQDDMAIIAGKENGFGYRPDDYGNTIATAAPLPVTGTDINLSGLIGRNNDLDVWKFTTPTASVNFQLTDALVGRNLDGELELWDSSGSVIASGPPWDPRVSATVPSGTYYLVARGPGDYGDVGQYTITGSLIPVTAPEIEVSVDGTPLKDSGTLNFGNTTLGQPVLKTVTVTNVGNAILTLVPFNWTQLFGAVTLVSNIGDSSLDPGESTSFTIQLDATTQCALADFIQLFSNDGDEGAFNIQLRGTVNPPNVPEIDVTGDIDFGTTVLAAPVTHTFTVTNFGTAALILQPLTGTMPQGFTLVNDLGSTLLNIGEATSFTIRLDASSTGTISGEIDLVNNDLDEGLLPLNLSGVVDAPPAPEIDLALGGESVFDGGTLYFGSTFQGVPVTATITVTNWGSTWLHLTPLNPASMPSGFSLVSNIDLTTLAPGQSTSITLRFNAATVGLTTGAIHLANNDSDEGSYDVTLSGTAIEPLRQVVDDGDAGNQLSGQWRRPTGSGYGRDTHYSARGDGSKFSTWYFQVPWGNWGYYRVYTTWTWNKHNASNATFAMFEGDPLFPQWATLAALARVNQRVAPGPKTSLGRWRYLATVNVTSGMSAGMLVVTLTNAANGYVVADAVRIEQISGRFRDPPYVFNPINAPGATGALASAALDQHPANTLNLASSSTFPLPPPGASSSLEQSTAPAATQAMVTAPATRTARPANSQTVDRAIVRSAKGETDSLSGTLDLLAPELSSAPQEAADGSAEIRDQAQTSLLTYERAPFIC